MPIFDFKCKSCDTVDEKIVSHGTETSQCSECGSESVRVDMIYNTNFKLNGRWFKTSGSY